MNGREKKMAYIFDGIILLCSMIGTIWEIWENGWIMLSYYTIDSNIFIAVCCLLDILYQRSGQDKKERMGWIKNLKYMATCCMMVTFFVVIFILAPTGGIKGLIGIMTEGALLFHHTICPVVAVISYYRADSKQYKLKKNMIYAGMLPTVLYAIVILSLNVKKILYGPYPFLYIYEQAVWVSVMWMLVILGLAVILGWVLWKGNDRLNCEY